MAAAAAPGGAGAAVGASNPSGDGDPRLRSPPPPGKGNKPVALADITNVGSPNTPRSVNIGDVVKENAKLIHLRSEKAVDMHKFRIALQASRQQNLQLAQTNSQMLAELNMGKDRIKMLQHELSCTTALLKENAKLIHFLSENAKIIELSRVEMHKLRIALQASQQQNLQLAQTNSKMLAELNMGKDRIKTLQHELSCTTSLLKVKDSEVERKNKTANQRRKEINSHLKEVLKVISSEGAAVEAHQIHGSVTSGVEHQLLKSQSAVPSRTVCQEPPQDATQKRGKNKRKSGSNECIKDTDIMQEHYMPHLQPMSMDHENPRKTQRQRSSRLDQVPCEIAEVSHKTLHDDIIVPSSSTLSVQEQHGPTAGKDTGKSLQNECSAVVHEELVSSVVEEIEINEQPQKEVNLKVQEGCSSVTGVEAHQIVVKACDTKQSHLAGGPSSVPFNITEPPKPPEDTCIKRKSQKRESARLNWASSETLHEDDVIAPLASSSSTASMEQKTTQKQNDACSSMKSTVGQVAAGRRSLRRAAEKVVSYKEIPLNVKMRRP